MINSWPRIIAFGFIQAMLALLIFFAGSHLGGEVSSIIKLIILLALVFVGYKESRAFSPHLKPIFYSSLIASISLGILAQIIYGREVGHPDIPPFLLIIPIFALLLITSIVGWVFAKRK